MRSKAPSVLIEQLVMVLVFALAATLCVQVFVLSDRMSRRSEARDRAVLQAQNAAETLKSCGGDTAAAAGRLGGQCSGDQWELAYDEAWQPAASPEQAAYYLCVTPQDSGEPLLGMAEITVRTAAGQELYTLSAAWQEGAAHA